MRFAIAREPLNRSIPKGELVEDLGDILCPHSAQTGGEECEGWRGILREEARAGQRTADCGVGWLGSFSARKAWTLLHQQHDLTETPGPESGASAQSGNESFSAVTQAMALKA